MKTQTNILQLLGLTALLLGASCAREADMELPGDTALLRPQFILAEENSTRSIVTGTSSGTSNGQINTVGMYITKQSDGTAYPDIDTNPLVYTYSDSKWSTTLEIKISNETANIYAFSPSSLEVTNQAASGEHSVPVSIPQEQTFNTGNSWECSGTDYLYGSKNSTVGDEEIVTATNKRIDPSVYLQHAQAQVIFKIQNAADRPADEQYDYIKSIKISSADGNPFFYGTGSMLLKDGKLNNLMATNELIFSPKIETIPAKVGPTGSPATVGYGLVAPLASDPSSVSITIQLGRSNGPEISRELTLSTEALNVKWEKGHRYTYNLELGKTALKIASAVEIGQWTSAAGEEIPVQPDDFVSVEAAIASPDALTTRAVLTERTAFSNDDVILITKTKGGSSTSASYTCWKPTNGTETWSSTNPLSLDASATYQGTFPSDYSGILSDQTTEDNFWKSDKLATPTDVKADKDGKVSFTVSNAFVHKNCKLTLVFDGKNSLTNAPVFDVKGIGLVTNASSSETIKLHHEKDYQYTAVVYPKGSSTAITITMNYGDVGYKATINCPLSAGTAYTYTLKLANDVLVPVGTEIAPWKSETITGDLTEE